MVKVIEIISANPVIVNQLKQTEDGTIEIKGHALEAVAGPSMIDINK